MSMPVCNATAFEDIQRGSCNDKAWYNTLQLSALGMAVAIDFVPSWGNRNNGHSWNALIINGETHPFEPFWDQERWKYKRIYDNTTFDILWGRFRLPKVYRNTYERHIGEIMVGHGDEDVPPLFLNPFIKDVSEAYFETTDLVVDVGKNLPNKYYYLCVSDTKEWVPVQWGKRGKDGKVTFKGMGRGILYLPAAYENGRLKPVAPLHLVGEDGSVRLLEYNDDKASIAANALTSYQTTKDLLAIRNLSAVHIIGRETPDSKGDTLCHATDTLDAWYNEIRIAQDKEYRYIDLVFPDDTIETQLDPELAGLREITFYEETDGIRKPLPPESITSGLEGLVSGESIGMIADGLSATGFMGRSRHNGDRQIHIDLGKPHRIHIITYIPYTKNYICEEKEYILSYWDNGWIDADTLQGIPKSTVFNNVPMGTAYKIRSTTFSIGRPFLYEDGIVKWH